MQRRDSNSRPYDYEYPPLTTRPGLLPDRQECMCNQNTKSIFGSLEIVTGSNRWWGKSTQINYLRALESQTRKIHSWSINNSVIRLGNLQDFGQVLKPLATIQFPNSLTFLGNFCKGVKISYFSSENIFGQILQKFGNFFLVTLTNNYKGLKSKL